MSATKIGENTTNIVELLFFTINLHFVTSNQIPTYRKPKFPLTSSICLLFLPLKMQGRLRQTKVYYSCFYFVWKEKTHKALYVAAVKTLFSSAYVIGITRSSRPEVFCKKACNFIKKETLAQVFSCKVCEISKNTFFHRTPLVAASVQLRSMNVFYSMWYLEDIS